MQAILCYGWPVFVFAVCQHSLASEPAPGGLLRRTAWLSFEIAGGRVTCPALARAPTRTFAAEGESAKEGLSINPSSDEPSLNYRYAAPDRQWTLEFRGTGELSLKDDITAGEAVTLQQMPDAPLQLTIQKDGLQQRLTGRTLWHLLVFQPKARTHLLPQLEVLNPDWQLAKQVGEIKRELLIACDSNWRDDRLNWRRCVGKLSDPDYQTRQAADRQLRSGGTAASAFLQSLEPGALAAEPRRRVVQILQAAAPEPDEPATIAAGWVYDAEVWCHLLRDEDPKCRRAAARHLAELLGRPLAYDPAADPKTRTAQVLTIQEGLLRR
jgi:hypothetical protein